MNVVLKYIKEMADASENSYFATSRNKPVPVTNDSGQYDHAEDFNDLVIHPDYLSDNYRNLEESRLLLLNHFPTVACLHAMINQELVGRGLGKTTSALTFKEVAFKGHPLTFPLITKASLKEWKKSGALHVFNKEAEENGNPRLSRRTNNHNIMYALLKLLVSKSGYQLKRNESEINVEQLVRALQTFAAENQLPDLPSKSTIKNFLAPYIEETTLSTNPVD